MERIRIAVSGPLTIYREALQQALAGSGFDVSLTDCRIECQIDPTIDVSLLVADDWDDASVAELRRIHPGSRIVILNSMFDYQRLRMAFELEVGGYLLKELSFGCLVGSLRLVALGEKVFPSQLSEAIRNQATISLVKKSSSDASILLSKRELEIVSCLIAGLPNKVISRRLLISEATVKVHLKSILRKLNLDNRTQVALWGVEAGIGGDVLPEVQGEP